MTMSNPADSGKKRLFVYECSGAGYPRTEPSCAGFLGIWPEGHYCYLFFDRDAAGELARWLQGEPGWSLRQVYQIDYDQWQQVSEQDQEVGPFLIRTTTGRETPAGREGARILRVDPGVVFGSGLHPTTRGCLLAIADLFRDNRVRTVVDLGTGTGILALACAGLGASRVIALDCNPLAVRVARRNVLLNDAQHTVDLLVAQDLGVLKRPADLLLMNIEWPCLRQVLQTHEWRSYRRVVMSGFLESQWDAFHALLPAGTRILFRENIDGWLTVVV